MKMKITDKGVLEIDLYELSESLTEDQRREFAKQVMFREELMEMVLDTVVTGSSADGWYLGDMATRLREKLVAAMPEIVQETVRKIVVSRDSAVALAKQYRDLLNRIAYHWPESVTPNLCTTNRPEWCTCTWTKTQVAELLDAELGEGWQDRLELREVSNAH